MRKSKQEFKDNLSNKITTGKFSSKDWLKTVKVLLGKDNNDDIPPLLLNGQPINDPNDKANALIIIYILKHSWMIVTFLFQNFLSLIVFFLLLNSQ